MDSKDKFQFVDIEDITNNSIKDNIEIVSSPDKVSIESSEKKEIEEPIVENKKEEDVPTIEISKKRHFSFEARIIVSVLSILILFIGACFLGLRVINHTTIQDIKYVENGDLNYQVCLKNATCEPENITYTRDDINIIRVTFDYNAKFEKKINHNGNYYVGTILSAYNNDKSSLLYNKENELVEKTSLGDVSDNISIFETVTIEYSKYRDMVKEYENNGGVTQVEVILYLEEDNETRRVSSLIIPLSKANFELTKNTVANENRMAKTTVNIWDSYSLVYSIASSFLVLISLILIYRTTRLVLKVTNNKSRFEEAVDAILSEYDNIIVIARDGYDDIAGKEICKVETFKELVELRDKINKMIIFSVVNDVKCEFILEDDDKLYKYIIKEADFTD